MVPKNDGFKMLIIFLRSVTLLGMCNPGQTLPSHPKGTFISKESCLYGRYDPWLYLLYGIDDQGFTTNMLSLKDSKKSDYR